MSEATEPINVDDYERLAHERLEPGPLAYFAGGAGDERTLRDNVEAFTRWQLRPRTRVDVSDPDLGVEVLGTPASMPVFVAPVAVQRLAHPEGEEAMARAAAAAGTVMCLSTLASASPTDVAAAAPDGARWFQLYCFRDRGVTHALIEEAEEAGFGAILLTVDLPYGGRRERDLRAGFEVPPSVTLPAVAAAVGAGERMSVQEVFGIIDPSLTWKDVEAIASRTGLPILVKGLLTAEDAELAVEHGAAGVVVSNHGGRQLDGVPASIDALPEVAEAVGDRAAVLMDGGVRRGTDVVIALALGAQAVLAGRAPLWGLAAAGDAGAQRVLELLRDEVRLALCLCGCPTLADVTGDHVQRPPYIRG